MKPWLLEELNLGEIREHSLDWKVAVLPMGATEPHNHHLPYGNDFLTVESLGREICAKAYDAGAKVILLPTIPFGVDSNLLRFPMAINVSLKSLESMLWDIIESLEKHGIHKLILLNGHGGNDLKPLLREWYGKTKLFIGVVDWWQTGMDHYAATFEHPEDHAGELETSVALHYYPELVDLERMTDGATRQARFEAIRKGWVKITRPWHALTESSGSGDPRAASVEKGRKYLDLVCDRLSKFIVELADETIDERFPF